MFNATCTDNDEGEIETYEEWLERQLISRIKMIEKISCDHDFDSISIGRFKCKKCGYEYSR